MALKPASLQAGLTRWVAEHPGVDLRSLSKPQAAELARSLGVELQQLMTAFTPPAAASNALTGAAANVAPQIVRDVFAGSVQQAPVSAETLMGIASLGKDPPGGPDKTVLATSKHSPLGEGSVFLSDLSGSPQLWFKPTTGDARALTALDGNPAELELSPDQQTLYFQADHGGDESYDLYALDLKSLTPRQLTTSAEASETSLRPLPGGKALHLSDEGSPWRSELYLRDLNTGAAAQLTKVGGLFGLLASPDGKTAAVTQTTDFDHGPLLLVDVATQQVREVAPPPGGKILLGSCFSPDGSTVLGTTCNAQGFKQLAAVDVKSGEVSLIGPQKWDIEEMTWHPELGILFTQNVGGRSALFQMEGPQSPAKELLAPEGRISDLHVTPDGGVHLIRSSSNQPPELLALDAASRGLKSLMPTLPEGVTTEQLAKSTYFELNAPDGERIDGFFYAPPVARLGGPPYPAVTFIHGGPEEQARDQFDAQIQALAQAGFAVIAPNYRGSAGYGQRFADLNNGDWGGADLGDVRAAAQKLISDGLVDADRLAVMGHSFGGFLTLRALHEASDLFSAGVDLAGIPDLASDYELTKDRFADWYAKELGTPEAAPELFRERSPMNHLEKFGGPLLVVHGENDSNVPIAQSEKMVAELKKRGKQAELVSLPREGHVLLTRSGKTTAAVKIAEFLKKAVG